MSFLPDNRLWVERLHAGAAGARRRSAVSRRGRRSGRSGSASAAPSSTRSCCRATTSPQATSASRACMRRTREADLRHGRLHYLREQRAAELEGSPSSRATPRDARAGAEADPRMRRHARRQRGRKGTARDATRRGARVEVAVERARNLRLPHADSPSGAISSSSAASSIRRTPTRCRGSCATCFRSCAQQLPRREVPRRSAARCRRRSSRSPTST